MISQHDLRREQVIRITFGWLVVGAVIMILLGMFGGIVVQYVIPRQQLPLIPDQQQLVSTVQEITISPNQAAARIVDAAHRSVVALAQTEQAASSFVGTGVLLTNDGTLATTFTGTVTNVIAYDFRGIPLQLDFLGHDALYGLTWWKIRDGVFAPLDLTNDDPAVGSELLALARVPETFQPRVGSYKVSYYNLPSEESPPGQQRIAVGSTLAVDETFVGSPLLSEDGKLAALLIEPRTGTALTALQLREGLARLIDGKREADPLAELGVTVRYAFSPASTSQQQRFYVEIINVQPGSLVADGGLKRGDHIIAVNDKPLDWQKSFITLVSQDLPLHVTVQRGEQEHTVILQAQTSPRPS